MKKWEQKIKEDGSEWSVFCWFWWGKVWHSLAVALGTLAYQFLILYIGREDLAKGDIALSMLNWLFSILWIALPIYILERLKLYMKEQEELQAKSIAEQMELWRKYDGKVDSLANKIHAALPRLTSLITTERTFESRLEDVQKVEAHGARWIYSKYISNFLEKSFSSFTIKLSPLKYSNFSGELFQLSEMSIYLTGSMTPSQWLDSLVDTSNQATGQHFEHQRDMFFNNELPIINYEKIISKENHSIVLKNNSMIAPENKLRIVCLNNYDWEYLFMSERSVDAYYAINNHETIPNSFFKNQAEINNDSFNPFQYEYALYDDQLLLKYDKEKELLTLISSQEKSPEFTAVHNFFEAHIQYVGRDLRGSFEGYLEIKERIRKKKIELIEEINKNKRLPHKLSYLYGGGRKWGEYIDRGRTRYTNLATQSIEDGIFDFFIRNTNNRSSLNIVELGAGTGERTARVYDTLGRTRVNSYEIVDISSSLLKQAGAELHQRHIQFTATLLDCCSSQTSDQDNFRQLIKDKDVFILSNSTLIADPEFEWESLQGAKSIFITIDLLSSSNTRQSGEGCAFNDYLEAKEFLLYPLKIFEIPIKTENINGLFTFHYDEESSIFKMMFNLQKYLNQVKFGEVRDFTEESRGIKENEKLDDLKGTHQTYLDKRRKLKSIQELVVLESLKFRHDKSKPTGTKQKISSFFEQKGFNSNIHLFEYNNGVTFAAILLTPQV